MTDRFPEDDNDRDSARVWKTARADRLTVLIDAKAYFDRLDEACRAAHHSIYILGWDFDANVALRPMDSEQTIAELLVELVDRTPNLHVYILVWRLTRWWAPGRRLPPFGGEWAGHERINFRYEMERPLESSRHEKFVVVDRALAFLGCTDISRGRWDVEGHGDEAAQWRVDPAGEPYRPHHDLQAVFDGPAVDVLASHFESVWTANADTTPVPVDGRRDIWPSDTEPDFSSVPLHFSRTSPAFAGKPAVHEVMAVLLALFARARWLIFLEMQYLTSERLTAALSTRLREPDGPCVVIILPRHENTLIERKVMGPLQAERLATLRAADDHKRLHVGYPSLPGDNDQLLLHSKLTLIDDAYLCMGSANFNHRSMGVDSELNLTVHADDDRRRRAVSRLRRRLVAEHLGLSIDDVPERAEAASALLALIAGHEDRDRALRPYPIEAERETSAAPIEDELSDPETLYGARELELIELDARRVRRRLWSTIGAVFVACVTIALVWTLTPAQDWMRSSLLVWGAEGGPITYLAIIAVLIIATLFMMPITVIAVVCFVLLGPWWGVVTALGVSLTSGAIAFWLGRRLDRRWLATLGGARLERVAERFRGAASGVTLVLMIRFVPIAPFTVVNLALGAARIRFLHFIIGSVFGMLPGLVFLATFADRALAFLRDPSPRAVVALIAILALFGTVVYSLTRWLEKRAPT